jgi:ribonuclease G
LARELLIAAGPGEWRAALLEDRVPVELFVARGDYNEAGSVHVGRVLRVVPPLSAALVDIGGDRPAFLPQNAVVPRGKQLHEGERVIVQIRREAQGGKAARLTMAVSPRERLQEICDRAVRLDPPARLDPLPSFATALAGAISTQPERVLVDDPAVIADIRAAFSDTGVEHLAESEWPIDLDDVFAEALSETLMLPGGGRVHFEATRAGMLTDVDSGTPEMGSPEQAGLATNLAAAATVARQIRLRNVGGGIVIDFVGLDRPASRERVRAALAEALAPDPARPQVLGWTRLGHLELVRPRRGRPLPEALLERRPDGALVKTAVTVAHEALRTLRREARAQPGRQWRLVVAPDVAAVLTGAAAPAVQHAEQRFARNLTIEPNAGRGREQFQITAM